jgi:hypothetical protein
MGTAHHGMAGLEAQKWEGMALELHSIAAWRGTDMTLHGMTE